MTTINANMTADQAWVPLANPNALEAGFYTIDDESIRVRSSQHRTTDTNPEAVFAADGRWVERGVGGTTPAAHSSGATLTQYYPEAPAEGGIANPVTEPLVINVSDDDALVASTTGGEITLGNTIAGGALLKVRGTSPFDGAVVRVEDIDSENQYVEINSYGAIGVYGDEENAQVVATSINGAAHIGATKANGSAYMSMSTNKGLSLGVRSAPSDGSILAGEACIWFDQTNGAAKLMIKAKTANGTVVTGEVALA